MEKAGKKAKKSGKPHSPSHSSASSREAGSSISGGNSNEEPEEQNYSDNGERPGFSQWVDEDEETTEPPVSSQLWKFPLLGILLIIRPE